MDESKYKRYEQIDHIYNVPDMYVGSDEQTERGRWILTDRIRYEKTTLPQAIEQLFKEILSNATDNISRSRRNGIDPGEVRVTMGRKTISVTNGGLPIPIEMSKEYGVYIPQMIFGDLLSSSNYETERYESGRNGLGAKLANVFSKEFSIDIVDERRQLRYQQTWRNNMKVMESAIITDSHGPSRVTVTYILDFERFGYTEYPDEAFYLFSRHCCDRSFTEHATIHFNDSVFQATIVEYAELCVPEGDRLYWSDEKTELCVIDTPHKAICLSFVNSMMTEEGGIHVEEAYKIISAYIKSAMNKKDAKGPKITLKDIRPNVSIIISCKLISPKYTSQSKSSVASPKPKIMIPPSLLEGMLSWDLIQCLSDVLNSKKASLLSKTDGRKKRRLFLKKLLDANEA